MTKQKEYSQTTSSNSIDQSIDADYPVLFTDECPKTEQGETVVKSTCWECWHRCGTLIYVKNGKVTRIAGNPEHPYNTGTICVKAKFDMENTYHPDRVLYPMKRTGDRGTGNWKRISWDEALNVVSDRFQEVREKYGPLSICGAVEAASAFVRGVAMTLLLRSLGSPNYVVSTELCGGASSMADAVTFMDNPSGAYIGPDFENAECFLLMGTNIPDAHPTGDWKRLHRAKAKGAKIIVVDPQKTQLAKMADLYLQIRPGTDAALGLAMMNVIINENLFDKDFVTRWCFGFDKLRQRVQEYPPEKVEKITWISAGDIKKAARLYATVKPAALAARIGIRGQTNAVQTCRILSILIALTGNLDVKGGNPLVKQYQGLMTYNDYIWREDLRLDKEIEAKTIGAKLFPLWSGPDSFFLASHSASVVKAMITGSPYPIKALYVTGRNILLTMPNSKEVEEGLRNLDFLVTVTQTMNPVAELSDIVLPKTTTLEENHIHPVYLGHCVGVTQKALEPLGDSWDDMKIAVNIVKRMKQKGYIQKNFIPWENNDEFIDDQLKQTGFTFDDLRERGFLEIPFKYREYEEKGFRTPTGKVELYSTILEKYGYDPLPCYEEPMESDYSTPLLAKKYPLILLTGVRELPFFTSCHKDHAWARRIHPDPLLTIHPTAAKERGIKDGDWVWIETPHSRVRCKQKARLTEDIHPRVVSAPVGWWFPEKPGPEHGCYESNINAAISYGPPWDPILGTPAVKGLICEIGKAE